MSALSNNNSGGGLGIVLVTGATGTIGKEAVSLLAHSAAGWDSIRIGTRSPTGASAQMLCAYDPARIEAVKLDFADQNTVDAAVAGVSVIVFIADFAETTTKALIDAVTASPTAPFVVKVSVIGARIPKDGEEISFFPKMHGLSEQAIDQAGIPMAAVQPTALSKHLSFMNPVVYTPGNGDVYCPSHMMARFMDYRDVEFAVAIAEDPTEAIIPQTVPADRPRAGQRHRLPAGCPRWEVRTSRGTRTWPLRGQALEVLGEKSPLCTPRAPSHGPDSGPGGLCALSAGRPVHRQVHYGPSALYRKR